MTNFNQLDILKIRFKCCMIPLETGIAGRLFRPGGGLPLLAASARAQTSISTTYGPTSDVEHATCAVFGSDPTTSDLYPTDTMLQIKTFARPLYPFVAVATSSSFGHPGGHAPTPLLLQK